MFGNSFANTSIRCLFCNIFSPLREGVVSIFPHFLVKQKFTLFHKSVFLPCAKTTGKIHRSVSDKLQAEVTSVILLILQVRIAAVRCYKVTAEKGLCMVCFCSNEVWHLSRSDEGLNVKSKNPDSQEFLFH